MSRHHRADHSLRRVHPVRAQQRGIVAGAVGDLVDDRGLVSLRRRVLSRVSAHRRRRSAHVSARTGQILPGLDPRSADAGDEPVHARVGHQALPGDLAPGHPGISRRYRRPFLSADPDRRRAHRFVRDRALHDAEVLFRAGARDGQPAHHRIDRICVVDIFILVGGFTIVCLMGMPVAYALGIAAIAAALYGGIPLEAVMLKVAGGMSGFSLLAIPFFILTGAIMAVGGMAERLVNLAKVFVGFIRGGMALVNIVASTMFGCISGSSVADTAAVGSVMIPQMIKNGYPRLFAVNVTISGSLQPLLVPPSHN